MNSYIEYRFTYTSDYPVFEVLPTLLSTVGFESFQETQEGLLAYIKKEFWHEKILEPLDIIGNPDFNLNYSHKEIPQENWNETWEKNFNPVTVEDNLTIRASFHKNLEKTPYEIIINPKMSFGTGHHETTYMMSQIILEMDMKDKTVLDMGCGTAVLAILAEMCGAKHVDAIDIDSWCVENAQENIEINTSRNINIYQGDASFIAGKSYDTIVANINRNILLEDMPLYVKSLNKPGQLLLSGFYTKDLPVIKQRAEHLGLKPDIHIEKNNWIAAKFKMEMP